MPPTTPETVTSDTHTYTVVRELGEGGQGRTRLVERQGEPGSRYVLKLLRLENAGDWKQVELFEREVTTLTALDHPGIPRLVDRILQDGRTSGIVETYVEGRTVAEVIAEHAPLSPEQFERILRDVLDVLAYLREQVPPVLHRDINPANVMIGAERTWLVDFGAVRVGGTTEMTSVGTFGYMAPEQIVGRAEPASDMYGLGMTLVSLAEGCDVGDLPVDPSNGQVDRDKVMTTVDPRVRAVVLDMIRPGLAERLGDPAVALQRLDAPPSLPAVPGPDPALARVPAALVGDRARLLTSAGIGLGLLLVAGSAAVVMLGRSGGSVSSPGPPVVARPAPAPVPVAPIRAVRADQPAPPPAPPPAAAPKPTPAPEVVPTTLDDDDSAALSLVTTPPGVAARVDGETTCTTPCSMRVPFGEHVVRFEHGAEPTERTVNVLDDTTLRMSFEGR